MVSQTKKSNLSVSNAPSLCLGHSLSMHRRHLSPTPLLSTQRKGSGHLLERLPDQHQEARPLQWAGPVQSDLQSRNPANRVTIDRLCSSWKQGLSA
jgi:hypothetical protein